LLQLMDFELFDWGNSSFFLWSGNSSSFLCIWSCHFRNLQSSMVDAHWSFKY
jgi:hypothetical protein